MANALRQNIAAAARAFAAQLFDVLLSMPLDELVETLMRGASTTPPSARKASTAKSAPTSRARARRGPADLDRMTDLVVKLLRGHPEGLRTEQIRAQLGLRREDVARPIAMALQAKKITKKGQKRATTYFAR